MRIGGRKRKRKRQKEKKKKQNMGLTLSIRPRGINFTPESIFLPSTSSDRQTNRIKSK